MSDRASRLCLFPVITYFLLISTLAAQESRSLALFYETDGFTPIRFVEEEDSLVADFSAIQQVVLLRHGQPQISKKGWFNRREIMDYMTAYDTVGALPFDKRPFKGSPKLKRVFTSTLHRSVHSAYLLFGEDMECQHAGRFNEFERKTMKFPNIKLPFGFWSGMSRALWLMGFNDRGIESFGEAKNRAFYDALFLEDEVSKNGRALLVAHGFLNKYIAKYLSKRGWKLVNINGKEYWGAYVLYRYQQAPSTY